MAKVNKTSVLVFLLILRSLSGYSAANSFQRDNLAPPESTVVSIFTYDSAGNGALHGTGFFVSSNGLVATARHVIQGYTKVLVQTRDARKYRVSDVVAEDPVHDLVVIRVNGTGHPFLGPGSSEEVQIKDHVRVYCDQFGFKGKIVDGTIASVENLADDYHWITINAHTEAGESGSPVLNEYGGLIGMVSALLGDNTKAFVIPVDSIAHLLDTASSGSDDQTPATFKARTYPELYADPNLAPAIDDLNDGDYQRGVFRMKLVCADFPDSGAACAYLGSFYSRLHMWKEANESFSKAVAIKPDYSFALACLSNVLAFQKQPEKALDTLKKALKAAADQHSDFPDTLYNAGVTLILLGQYDQAQKTIQMLRNTKTADADRMADELSKGLEIARPR